MKDEFMRGKFWELGGKLRSWNSNVIISGLLPLPCDNEYRNRKIGPMNEWLKRWSRKEDFKYPKYH